ncbi:MAG: hypothetical protein OEQ39_23585 [Gammaproteobacteria bacterium]|nr:hypothetical protein [Gammaproteobacteria bacterium]MDH3467159.1 hypothetical protein [Gammaproteobacteria bacterium]
MKRNVAVLITLIFSISAYAGEWTYSGTPQIIESGESNKGVPISDEEHQKRLKNHQIHASPDSGPAVHESELPMMTTTRKTEYRIINKEDQILSEIKKLRREQRVGRILDRGNQEQRDIRDRSLQRDIDQLKRKHGIIY